MRITITESDIREGRRCDPDCCPVGRALSRAGVLHFGVSGARVMVAETAARAAFLPLPRDVRDWILEFDCSNPVQPISFELDLPEQRERRTRRHRKPEKRVSRLALAHAA